MIWPEYKFYIAIFERQKLLHRMEIKKDRDIAN